LRRVRSYLQTFLEQDDEELQGILVHRVNEGEISNDEVDDRASLRDNSVYLTCCINLLCCDLGLCHTLVDGVAGDLRGVQGCDEVLFLEDASLCFCDEFEDLILEFLELSLVL
jgi:hypothetical protein